MLIGRRTYEVGKRGVETANRGKVSGEDYGGQELEILGADVAGQRLRRGSSTRSL